MSAIFPPLIFFPQPAKRNAQTKKTTLSLNFEITVNIRQLYIFPVRGKHERGYAHWSVRAGIKEKDGKISVFCLYNSPVLQHAQVVEQDYPAED